MGSDLDKVYSKFKKVTNMSCSEMKKWSNNKCSNKASLTRKPIKRNIRLLCKRKSKWTKRDIKDAKRTIGFVKRMSGMKSGSVVSDKCPLSKRDIALKNWAFDPVKG